MIGKLGERAKGRQAVNSHGSPLNPVSYMGAPGIMFLNVNNVGISSFTLSLKDLESIDKFLHNLLHQKQDFIVVLFVLQIALH